MPDTPDNADGQQPWILSYADAQTDGWTIIARFEDEVTAHLCASKLASNGIESRLIDRSYSRAG
jgi:hypothetical protein